MADVGVEAGLPLDPGLQLVDHGVEGAGQALEVGIGRLGLQPGVEAASCDGDRRPGDGGQGAQRSSTGEPTQAEAEHVVTKPVTTRVRPITRRVWPRSASENTSK